MGSACIAGVTRRPSEAVEDERRRRTDQEAGRLSDRPGLGLDDERGPGGDDDKRREHAVEAQLAFLKKKFGKKS